MLLFTSDNFRCSFMWREEDAFYPCRYFKEASTVHPEWNVCFKALLKSSLFSPSVFLILDVLTQTVQGLPGAEAFWKALISYLKLWNQLQS